MDIGGGAQRLRPADRQPRDGDRARSRSSKQRTAPGKLEAVFIRAPIIRRVAGKDARCWRATKAIRCWWKQGRHLVATFHPELTGDSRVHALFLEKL